MRTPTAIQPWLRAVAPVKANPPLALPAPEVALPSPPVVITLTEDGADSTGVVIPGGVPCAVAVFSTEPLSRSAWVTVYTVIQSDLDHGWIENVATVRGSLPPNIGSPNIVSPNIVSPNIVSPSAPLQSEPSRVQIPVEQAASLADTGVLAATGVVTRQPAAVGLALIAAGMLLVAIPRRRSKARR